MDEVGQMDDTMWGALTTQQEEIPQLEDGHCSCDNVRISMDPENDFYGICLECGYDHLNHRFVNR